jgi:hypothetical protein
MKSAVLFLRLRLAALGFLRFVAAKSFFFYPKLQAVQRVDLGVKHVTLLS